MSTDTFRSFNHFVMSSFGMWKICVDPADIKKSTCTCPVFFKQYICKHLLGTLIRLRLLIAPLSAKNQPIGVVRGPGRPRLAKKALFYQPDHYDELMVDDDDESGDENDDDATQRAETRGSTNPNIAVNDEDNTDEDVDQNLDVEAVVVVVEPVVVVVEAPKKKRGRPIGSKNKTKNN